MLVLQKINNRKTIKDYIYNELVGFLKIKISEAKLHKYVSDDELIKKVKFEKHKRIVLPASVSEKLCIKLSSIHVVIILIGFNKNLADIVDINIDPLEKNNLKYFYGLSFMPSFIANGQYGVDIANHLNISLDDLKTKVAQNDAELNLVHIVSLVYQLEWDTGFFETNIAYLSSPSLTSNIEKYVKNFVSVNNTNLLQFKCNCHDAFSVEIAEKNNYSFVDIRLTLEQTINEKNFIKDDRKDLVVRRANESDIETLIECGKDLYSTSRYYYDNNFNIEKLNEFYSSWISKAVLGTFDDYCYALCKDDLPIGFCSIKINKFNTASIGVLGINQNFSHLGFGRYMLNKVIQALFHDGVSYIDVVTQGRNYAAQRLYQRCGFITKSSELWYHKWFNQGK